MSNQDYIRSYFPYLEDFFRFKFICDDDSNIRFNLTKSTISVFNNNALVYFLNYGELISLIIELEDDNLKIVNILKEIKTQFPLGVKSND